MRELFSLLDKDGDGVVTDSDLSAMLHSLGNSFDNHHITDILGQDSSLHALKKMFSMMRTPLDFPVFLTYITSLKSQLSTRDDLAGAFTSFDENDSGYIDFDDLKNDLMTTGPKRMTEEQVNTALKGFVEKTGKNKGKILYLKFLDTMMGERTQT
jgi:Ca2+-binding EF-hand superfamily protein